MYFIKLQRSCFSLPIKVLFCGHKFQEYTCDHRLNGSIVPTPKYQFLLLKLQPFLLKRKQIQLIYRKPLKTLQREPKPVGPLNSFLEVPQLEN